MPVTARAHVQLLTFTDAEPPGRRSGAGQFGSGEALWCWAAQMERRERLRKLCAELEDATVVEAMDALEPVGAAPQQFVPSTVFYTEGPPELQEARVKVSGDRCPPPMSHARFLSNIAHMLSIHRPARLLQALLGVGTTAVGTASHVLPGYSSAIYMQCHAHSFMWISVGRRRAVHGARPCRSLCTPWSGQ